MINTILSAIGGIMGSLNVGQDEGNAVLGFVEFWLVIGEFIVNLFQKGFDAIGGLFG